MTQTKRRPERHVELITWPEFQREIAPIWNVEDPETIPIINNPYRVIQYPLVEWPKRIIHFAYRYIEDGDTVGYTSLYNVSDDTVRTRGIYVLPNCRKRGVASRMLEEGMKLFPDGFRRLIGFFRESNVEKFKRNAQMAEVPGTDWFWSTYQQIRIRMLYRDRADLSVVDVAANRAWVENQLPVFGLGGSNNLARTWNDEEWLAFAEPHAWTYEDGKIDLDF